jgi:hypothetical protein
MLRGFLCEFRIETMCKCCILKKQANQNLFQLFNLVKEKERVQIILNGNYWRLLFRPLREALQIAECFEQAYM